MKKNTVAFGAVALPPQLNFIPFPISPRPPSLRDYPNPLTTPRLVTMSDPPPTILHYLKVETNRTICFSGMNGDTVVTTITNGDSDCVEKKENSSNNHQIDTTTTTPETTVDNKVEEGSNGAAPIPQELMNTTPASAAPVAPPIAVIEAQQSSSPPPVAMEIVNTPAQGGVEAVAVSSPPVSATPSSPYPS
eukprot:sb/3471108/